MSLIIENNNRHEHNGNGILIDQIVSTRSKSYPEISVKLMEARARRRDLTDFCGVNCKREFSCF